MIGEKWAAPERSESPLPLAEQIAELKRELKLRENVYPSFVHREKLNAREADQHYLRLLAALKTLMWVERYAARLRTINLDPSKADV